MSGQIKAKKQSSGALAIVKTIGFFAVLFLAGWGFSSLIFSQIPREPNFDKDYTEVTFNELSSYDWYSPEPNEPVRQDLLEKNLIPDEIKKLNGKKVSVAGFMLPIVNPDEDGKTPMFAVNGNYDMCYFGLPTQKNDWVIVQVKDNKKAPFTHKPITIYGTLEVGEEIKDGEVVSLYRMVADAVVTDRGTVK